MYDKLRMVAESIWLKIRHPKVKLNGFSSIRIGTEIKIKSNGSISIGRGVSIERNSTIAVKGGNVYIGNNTSINRNGLIMSQSSISIGKDVAIGPNVCIYDHDHVWNEDGLVKGKYSCGNVIIHDKCWIGANVTILAGSEIGKCSVIGAGTVVKGYIPDHTIVYDRRDKKLINMGQGNMMV